jgi:uncharacterized phage-associated protein
MSKERRTGELNPFALLRTPPAGYKAAAPTTTRTILRLIRGLSAERTDTRGCHEFAERTRMLRFRTTTTKKIQAAAVLLRAEGNRADRLRLLKLLYIADREALKERGFPIVGGRVVAMDHGPLHSEVYSLVKGEHESEQVWAEHFSSEGNTVALLKDPGRLDLSPYEIEKLAEVSNRYRLTDTWAVADETHDFGEYVACYVEGTSTTIPLEKILGELGFTPDEIADIRSDAEDDLRMVKAIERSAVNP